MILDDRSTTPATVLNSLNFSQSQVNFILGHSLRSVYQDFLNAPLPDHLQVLLEQIDAGSTSPEEHAE
jgi:hypothetical protein